MSETIAEDQAPEVTPDNHPGQDDGSAVIDSAGNDTGEKVVYEYDEAGNMTGWHKEPAA